MKSKITTKAQDILLEKIEDAAAILAKSDGSKIVVSNFNWGYLSGLEAAARELGIDPVRIREARRRGEEPQGGLSGPD